jgi:hypothetical protein
MPYTRCLFVCILVVSTAAARQNTDAVSTDVDTAGVSLKEAKESFRNLQDAKRAGSEKDDVTSSNVPVPELNVFNETRRASVQGSLQQKKSKNWLLDGVLSGVPIPPRIDSTAPRTAEIGRKTWRLSGVDERLDDLHEVVRTRSDSPEPYQFSSNTKSSDPLARTDLDSTSRAKANNPLSDFMSSWISPLDRQLLLPNPATRFELVGRDATFSGLREVDRAVATRSQIGEARSIAPEPNENPYARVFAPPAADSARRIPPPELGIPGVSMARIQSYSPASSVERSVGGYKSPAVPKLGPVELNERYFRQLNRF